MDPQDAVLAEGPENVAVSSSPSPSVSNEGPSTGQATGLESKIEKRRESRYLCGDPAEVRSLSGNTKYMPATILDISRSGLRLDVASCFWKNQEIEIKLPRKAIVFGQVRYSRCVDEMYHIGVHIIEVFYAERGYISDHLHEDQLWLYSGGKGLSATEVLGVRGHLLKCKVCSDRYREVVQVGNQLGVGSAKP
jgi:hypothetical protein